VVFKNLVPNESTFTVGEHLLNELDDMIQEGSENLYEVACLAHPMVASEIAAVQDMLRKLEEIFEEVRS